MPEFRQAPATCAEKGRLAGEIQSAMREIIRLNAHQFRIVVEELNGGSNMVEGELAQARVRKDALIQAYKEHVSQHHC
jgi:phenylpyruvate tautomerase PptA (4-oxalocrotonate tautomerase family)